MDKDSRKNTRRILLVLGRLALAGVFLFAAFAKMRPPPGTPWSANSVKLSLTLFAFQVDSYQLLSHAAAITVAKILPPFEMLLGLWLLSGVWLRFSAFCTSLLLAGFIFATVSAHMHGLDIDCGCFGPGEHIGPKTFVLDGLLFALAIAVTVGAFSQAFSRVRSQSI
jgi:uncharacterized membrane protein YphA (DoxX/SURF4 family)